MFAQSSSSLTIRRWTHVHQLGRETVYSVPAVRGRSIVSEKLVAWYRPILRVPLADPGKQLNDSPSPRGAYSEDSQVTSVQVEVRASLHPLHHVVVPLNSERVDGHWVRRDAHEAEKACLPRSSDRRIALGWAKCLEGRAIEEVQLGWPCSEAIMRVMNQADFL
ncbi:hypothetical protein FA13DRAFT_841626 [Coprinellus micaceus]|uniref:Uncharacterized protein n=1 Tax=Coprinellus micaceus TaxID=71717 RepID=A0A4Y7T1S4_COPMI|nr:hypothetical protein FA13DRAFT_841626 [Coprinellus micaceus]